MAKSELDIFIEGIPQPTSYLDSGFDGYLDRNLFFSPNVNSFSAPNMETSAADMMNSSEGFISGSLNIDLVRGAITVKDDAGVERVIIGNF